MQHAPRHLYYVIKNHLTRAFKYQNIYVIANLMTVTPSKIEDGLRQLVYYGVHTSLKIPPNTWFGRLALGCKSVIARRNDRAIAQTTG
jgi:hypothetical protein